MRRLIIVTSALATAFSGPVWAQEECDTYETFVEPPASRVLVASVVPRTLVFWDQGEFSRAVIVDYDGVHGPVRTVDFPLFNWLEEMVATPTRIFLLNRFESLPHRLDVLDYNGDVVAEDLVLGEFERIALAPAGNGAIAAVTESGTPPEQISLIRYDESGEQIGSRIPTQALGYTLEFGVAAIGDIAWLVWSSMIPGDDVVRLRARRIDLATGEVFEQNPLVLTDSGLLQSVRAVGDRVRILADRNTGDDFSLVLDAYADGTHSVPIDMRLPATSMIRDTGAAYGFVDIETASAGSVLGYYSQQEVQAAVRAESGMENHPLINIDKAHSWSLTSDGTDHIFVYSRIDDALTNTVEFERRSGDGEPIASATLDSRQLETEVREYCPPQPPPSATGCSASSGSGDSPLWPLLAPLFALWYAKTRRQTRRARVRPRS